MKRYLYIFLLMVSGWIIFELYFPKKSNLRIFDPMETSKLDTEMWRSYYEKKPLKLYFQSTELMRKQLKAPFWRSLMISYNVAKAAFLFKDGKNRTDYNEALPYLEKYYQQVSDLSDKPFNVKSTAKMELEWWIIRREKKDRVEWVTLQAKVAAQIYQKPPLLFYDYGKKRTEAMFFRDGKGENISENDWKKINKMLDDAWLSLYKSTNTE
jgi:hypothetical protein